MRHRFSDSQLKEAHNLEEIIEELLGQVKKAPVFEISRRLDETWKHVAFVDDETLAQTFCDKHKDCSYGQINMTKYPLHLEGARTNVPCCESCSSCEPIPDDKYEGYCKNLEENVSLTGKCEDWTFED